MTTVRLDWRAFIGISISKWPRASVCCVQTRSLLSDMATVAPLIGVPVPDSVTCPLITAGSSASAGPIRQKHIISSGMALRNLRVGTAVP